MFDIFSSNFIRFFKIKFRIEKLELQEPRRKRSIKGMPIQLSQNQQNPYFKGEILKSVIKKDGRNTWQ